jgi:integrase/recombinase XerC
MAESHRDLASLHAGSSLEEGITLFLDHLRIERNYAEYTLNSYRCDLRQFARFLYPRVEDLRLPLRAVQREQVAAFVAELEEKGLKASTIARKLAALRSLFRYLCRERVLAANPARAIAAPQVTRSLPRHLPVEQVAEAIEAPSQELFSGVRDRTILEVFYGGGIRLGELVALNLSSLDLDDGTLKVMGKGRKERIAPVGAKALETLKAYLLRRAEVLLECDMAEVDAGALFLNGRGKRLSRRTVQRVVERYLSAVAEGESLSPHLLRHSFAIHLLDAGADLVAVKELLGHAALSTTQVYTEVSLEHLQAIYAKAHPRGAD